MNYERMLGLLRLQASIAEQELKVIQERQKGLKREHAHIAVQAKTLSIFLSAPSLEPSIHQRMIASRMFLERQRDDNARVQKVVEAELALASEKYARLNAKISFLSRKAEVDQRHRKIKRIRLQSETILETFGNPNRHAL